MYPRENPDEVDVVANLSAVALIALLRPNPYEDHPETLVFATLVVSRLINRHQKSLDFADCSLCESCKA